MSEPQNQCNPYQDDGDDDYGHRMSLSSLPHRKETHTIAKGSISIRGDRDNSFTKTRKDGSSANSSFAGDDARQTCCFGFWGTSNANTKKETFACSDDGLGPQLKMMI